MSRIGHIGSALYRGDVSYDFVGHRRWWYMISGAIVAVAVVALLVRGLTLSIDFKGGSEFSLPQGSGTVAQAQAVAASENIKDAQVTTARSASGSTIRVEVPNLTSHGNATFANALAASFGVPQSAVSVQIIGPSWGKAITSKAVEGLVIFLLLIVLFLSLYFEWRMAVAALIAVLHDVVITIGVYALFGFVVSPATVIGVLTILGYSLYDTVVVFDKVKENTRGLLAGSKMTYSQAANLAVNQTLVRSINTSVIALLPVASILFVGPLLGADTLKDLSLALFVGIAAGTYSSIFVATPVLAQLKERQPEYRALAKRVAARTSAPARSAAPALAGAAAAAATAVAVPPVEVRPASGTQRAQPKRSGPARRPGQKKKR